MSWSSCNLPVCGVQSCQSRAAPAGDSWLSLASMVSPVRFHQVDDGILPFVLFHHSLHRAVLLL